MSDSKILKEVMKTDLVTLDAGAPAADGARHMRDNDVGNVLVTRNGQLFGIVTDRDMVVRCVADGKDPQTTRLEDLCSESPVTLEKDSGIGDAIKLMTERAIRRVPVVADGKPIGIVSLGDLAVAQDRKSALGEISAARPNR